MEHSDDLKSAHYREYAMRALEFAGFVRASPKDASLLVSMEYGRGEERQHTVNIQTPNFGQTCVSATRTTGSLTSFGSSCNFSGTTSFTPVTPYLLLGGAEKIHSPPGSTQKAETYAHKVKKLMTDRGPALGY